MSRIKATILGTTAGAPTRERGHSSVYVSYDDGTANNILFDCGEGTQRQIMIAGLDLLGIEAVFITHFHGDHCLGVPGMVDTMGFDGRKDELEIYSPEPTRLRKLLGVTRSMSKFSVRARKVPCRGPKTANVCDCGRFQICSIPARHGVPAVSYALIEKDKVNIDVSRAAALGLPESGEIYREIKSRGSVEFRGRKIQLSDISSPQLGKKLVYSGDTEVNDGLKELAKGADLLIQDCTYFCLEGDEKPYLHASLPEVMKMIREAGVKRTVLTHISRRHSDIGELRNMVKDVPGVDVAEDFCAVVI